MKQECQLQIGVTQYKNAATPLSTSEFSNEVCNFVLAQGAQKLTAKVNKV